MPLNIWSSHFYMGSLQSHTETKGRDVVTRSGEGREDDIGQWP